MCVSLGDLDSATIADIFDAVNPVWEETAFIPLSDDEVKSGEDLAVTLWDSDKRSADVRSAFCPFSAFTYTSGL